MATYANIFAPVKSNNTKSKAKEIAPIIPPPKSTVELSLNKSSQNNSQVFFITLGLCNTP